MKKKILRIPDICKKCKLCTAITMLELQDQNKPIIVDGKITGFEKVLVNYKCEHSGKYIINPKIKNCKIVRIIEEVEDEPVV